MKRIILGICLILAFAVFAEIPSTINYQGKLTDAGGVAIDGTRQIKFTIFDAVSGGSALWTETHPAVDVAKGLFDVRLGTVTAFPSTLDFSEQYWIAVEVDGEVLSPRQALSSVPYAFRAAIADSVVGGSGGGGDLPGGTNGQTLRHDGANWVASSALFNAGTNIGIGTTSPGARLHIEQNSTGGAELLRLFNPNTGSSAYTFLRVGQSTSFWGIVSYNYSDREFSIQSNLNSSGGLALKTQTGAPITFVTNLSSERMRITPSGNVGIGISSPASLSMLHINGDDALAMTRYTSSTTGTSNADGFIVGLNNVSGDALLWNYENRYISFGTNNTERMRILSSGNVGIGTSSPSYLLHVNGSARVNSLNINGAYSLPTSAGTTLQFLRGDGTWASPLGTSGWGLTGNAGTTAGTNFVGTTDAQDLVFKTSNTERVRFTTGGRVAIGNFSNPEADLELRNTIAAIYVRTYNDYSWQDGGRLVLQRMGGTQTSPSATQAGQGIGALDFRGGYGTSVSGVTSASIKSVSPVTWVSGSSARGGDLRFYTINIVGGQSIYDNERMRIGSLGGVGININPTPSTSTNHDPDAYMHVYGGIGLGPANNSISLDHGQQNSMQIASDTYYGGVNDNHSGYLIYSIMPGGWTTGELHFACATNWGTYNTTTPALRVTQSGTYANGTFLTSDRRLKSGIAPFTAGLAKVMEMEPVRYNKHIAEDMSHGNVMLGRGTADVGLIAQDLYEILPEVVSKPADENAELWAVDYSRIVPILVNAIQEQQELIEDLLRRIEELEAK